ncbi:MAG: DoxX family protein [Desulfuromonadales bacterium]
MFRKVLSTQDDVAPLVLRVMLGIVFLPHGAQKVLGWFGGYGLEGTLNYFTQTMGIPLVLAILVIAVEFLGAMALIVGFLTRLIAFGIACDMAGAIYFVHLNNGFFMNWSGKQAGEGFEFHLLAITIAAALMITGSGKASVDLSLLSKNS